MKQMKCGLQENTKSKNMSETKKYICRVWCLSAKENSVTNPINKLNSQFEGYAKKAAGKKKTKMSLEWRSYSFNRCCLCSESCL